MIKIKMNNSERINPVVSHSLSRSELKQDDQVGAADAEHAGQGGPADLEESLSTERSIKSDH